MKIDSDDYHDYVFRDGRLIGEFDQMYRKAAGVPWGQDKTNHQWYTRVALGVVTRALEDGTVSDIHEVGCGLGYFLSNFQGDGRSVSGTDISPEAIRIASGLFPEIAFTVDDIRNEYEHGAFDLVIVSALFWYVFPAMGRVCENLVKLVRPGGYLFINHNFPRLDKPFVGKEVLPDPDALLGWFSDAFFTIVDCRFMKMEHPDDGPNICWLGRRK